MIDFDLRRHGFWDLLSLRSVGCPSESFLWNPMWSIKSTMKRKFLLIWVANLTYNRLF